MSRSSHFVVGFLLLTGWLLPASGLAAQSDKRSAPEVAKAASPEQLAFFEKHIRPVLVRECYACHATTAEKIKGGFNLDTREGIRKGGDTSPAVVPGDVARSLLVKAIKQTDDELKMPPKKKLSDDIIADFEKWITMGAPDPRDCTPNIARKPGEIDIEAGRKFWAFQPPRKPTIPSVKDTAWPRSDIDWFLLSELEAKGLKAVADADARTLIRRLYFDLIGLPPTPEDVETFVKDHSAKPQAAVEAVVDALLASPQFGERWGRHWLDVARYAESSGRSVNFAYPHAWRYRDYVIAAFNADKPYAQFIREQLAGDLLPALNDNEKAELLVATAFLALGPKAHDERNPRQFRMDLADEQIDATFQAFQGLTVACARCHDHKFDPIPQKDYYALAGIFTSTETCYGTIRVIQSNHPSPLVTLPKDADVMLPLEPLSTERRAAIDKQIQDVRDQMSKLSGPNSFIQRLFSGSRVATLQSQLAQYEADGTPKPLAMGVRESRLAADTRLLQRGELDQPGETVRRGFPQVLTTQQPTMRRFGGSGRRELADWIASADNPLTARVMVNRIWLHLTGRGLVPMPDNLGASGQPPSHPALLDYLSVSFTEDGWSVKKLIRSIVLSRAYQLSSQFDAKNFEADPDNVLVWRIPKRRLEAEALRDTMLSLAGKLDLTPPKGSPVARGGEGNLSFRFRGGAGDQALTDPHRSVYLSIVRDGLPELMLFDFPDPSLITGERATTTVPAQSLYLMNNPFVIRQAESMADRLLASSDDDASKLTRGLSAELLETTSDNEGKNALQFLDNYSKKQTRRAAWTAPCQALFASAEFSHR